MKVVYHGSKEHGIKRLEPRKSTHGTYVYAIPDKALAIHFSGRCGDDLTYSLGHYSNDENGPWQLIENIPGAFEKMYSNRTEFRLGLPMRLDNVGNMFWAKTKAGKIKVLTNIVERHR